MTKTSTSTQRGFTAIELLIAIAIGVLLLAAAYQLYAVAAASALSAAKRAEANNLAYRSLREKQYTVGSTCVNSTQNIRASGDNSLVNARVSTTTRCGVPHASITRISVTVYYDDNGPTEITHAAAVSNR